ncbi:MAG: hypothetical protein SGBAC_001479 [Bacillariaceae sp.]
MEEVSSESEMSEQRIEERNSDSSDLDDVDDNSQIEISDDRDEEINVIDESLEANVDESAESNKNQSQEIKSNEEETNSDSIDLDVDVDGKSEISDTRGEEANMNTIDESSEANDDDTAATHGSQSPKSISNEEVHDEDREVEPNPSQVTETDVVLAARNSSNTGSPGMLDSESDVDVVVVVENEIAPTSAPKNRTSDDNSPTMAPEPLVNSIGTAAGEAREQRANKRRANREEQKTAPGKLSPKGESKGSTGSIGTVQLLNPGLLSSATTKTDDNNYDGVPMVLSPKTEKRRIDGNRDEKAGWRNDEYVLGMDTDSSSQLQQPGAVRIGTQHGSSALSEPDSKRLSSKSSAESKLTSSGRFVSAAVIDENELQQEFENKMRADMVSAEQVEAYDEPGFCNKNALKIILTSLVVIITLVAGLVVGLGQASDRNVGTVTNVPTLSPTLLDDDQYLQVLYSSISGDEVFRDPTTPQSKALEMISREIQGNTFDVRNVSDQYLSERYALRVLYYSTAGDAWLVNDHNFNSTMNTCTWMNATQGNRLLCNDLGEVTDMFLNVAGLNGTIPSELGVLTSLSQLSLAKNNLSGTIPSSLGELKDMKFMQFALNSLSGRIPAAFERFTKLERFIMHVNQLTGTLPNLWRDEFRRLRINDNKLTGTIPEMPTQMALDWFQVSDNAFTGTLPLSLAAQPKLITLAISNNRFEGTIPNQYSALTMMENFVVDGNLFHGTLPSMLGRLNQIDWFWVNDNKFSGNLPASLQAMTKASQFKFHGNNFNGTLPTEWSVLESLVSLDVSNNPNLEGTVPLSYIGLEALSSFALSGTGVSGGLAGSFCATQQLDSLSAECGGATPSIECPCCTTCCIDGYCALENLNETCSSRAMTLQNFDQFRDASCTCNTDSTQVSCNESCESCSVDLSSCVQSSGFGHHLNPVDGERLDFFNTFEYTKGPYTGTVITFQESVIDDLTDECEVTVDGEKCRACRRQVCKSDLVGLTIVCDNLSAPAEIKTCDDQTASSYLDAFVYWDPARVSGCDLFLYRVIEDSN